MASQCSLPLKNFLLYSTPNAFCFHTNLRRTPTIEFVIQSQKKNCLVVVVVQCVVVAFKLFKHSQEALRGEITSSHDPQVEMRMRKSTHGFPLTFKCNEYLDMTYLHSSQKEISRVASRIKYLNDYHAAVLIRSLLHFGGKENLCQNAYVFTIFNLIVLLRVSSSSVHA